MRRTRRAATVLIVCGLLAWAPRAAAQGSAAQAMEAFQLTQQAYMMYQAGQYDEAISLAERSLAMGGGGYNEVDVAFKVTSPLSILGNSYRARGDYARAEAALRRLLSAMENTPGGARGRLPYARAHSELAAVYEAKGDYARALQLRARSNELIERNLAQALTPSLQASRPAPGRFEALMGQNTALMLAELTGSESYRQSLVDSVSTETNATVSLHVGRLPQDAQAAQLALTAVLQRKGRVLDAAAEQVGVLRRHGNAQDQQLVERAAKAYAQLAAMSNSEGKVFSAEEIGSERAGQQFTRELMLSITRVQQVRDELRGVENAISRRSAELRPAEPPVTIAAVREHLPADAALVEIVSYKPFDPKRGNDDEAFGKPRYAAYVLRRDAEAVQAVELGEAAAVDEAAARWRAALRDPRRADAKELGRGLDERVMRPVRKLLGPARRVLVAPDGALNLIPFAALVDEKGQYLVENYSVGYLTSGRDLLRLRAGGESRGGPVVLANPQFDTSAVGARPPARPSDQLWVGGVVKDLSALNYPPLPGTAAEAAALGRLLPGATLLTEGRATEAALKGVSRPRLLHIATHGFFLTDQEEAAAPPADWRRVGVDVSTKRMTRADPLLRSGLILAGVRQRSSGAGEDGVLTALEVAGMDLWGTGLVVLSACETGLGDVRAGEGVYGLRRALVLAGSQGQLMSLWKVSDAGTSDLMSAYYKLLQHGAGRTEGLRQVQLEMLQGKLLPSPSGAPGGQKGKRETAELEGEGAGRDYRHPFYWASFIPSGDWRSLAGQEK